MTINYSHVIYTEHMQDVKTVNDKNQVIFIAESLLHLAHVATCHGDDVAARALYEESLSIARELDYKSYIAFCLEELASLVSIQEQPACAARLWEIAKFLRDTVDMPPPAVEGAACDRLVSSNADVPIHFDGRDFTAAQSEGWTLLPEQTIPGHEPEPMSMLSSTAPPSTHPVKPSPAYPAGLTAREVEVLCLVAQGLTDTQVAEQLVISPRTVNWHLTLIYSKLQVSSRCAATRFAIEHHLV